MLRIDGWVRQFKPMDGLALIPLAIVIYFIATLARPTPLTDEWVLLQNAMVAHDPAVPISQVWSRMQWNFGPHPLVIPNLIYVPLGNLFHYDTRALVAVTIASFAAAWAVFRLALGAGIAAVFVSLLLFSPSHFMEYFWGFQFTIALSWVLPCIGLALLDQVGRREIPVPGLFLFFGFSFITGGVLSSAGGAFGFPAAAALFLLKRIPWLTKIRLALLCIAAFGTVALRLRSSSSGMSFQGIDDVLVCLTALGSVLIGSPVALFHFGIDERSLLGAVIIAGFVWAFILSAAGRQLDRIALPAALFLFGCAILASIALARDMLGNWHVQMALPAVCGALACAWLAPKSSQSTVLRWGWSTLAFVALVGYYLGFTDYGPKYREYAQGIEAYMLTVEANPDQPKPYPGGGVVSPDMIDFLRRNHHPLCSEKR